MDLSTIPSQTLVDDVVKGVKVIGTIASVEERVMPWAELILGAMPFAGTVFGAIAVAQPWIDKVAEYAPQVAAVVETKGVPYVDALKEVAPHLVGPLRNAIATLVAADPNLSHITMADITDAVLEGALKTLLTRSFFGPQDPRFDRGDVSQVGG